MAVHCSELKHVEKNQTHNKDKIGTCWKLWHCVSLSRGMLVECVCVSGELLLRVFGL